MQLAMIGLGKMGGNMVERLMRHGHSVVAFDRDPATVCEVSGARRRAGERISRTWYDSSRSRG